MATFRERALDEAAMHSGGRFYAEDGPVSKYFGRNVLDLDKMRGYMSQEAYEAVLASVKFGAKLDRSVSNEAYIIWNNPIGKSHNFLKSPLEEKSEF